jgi:hypothetical protein
MPQANTATDQITVLLAFQTACRAIAGFGTENCWISDNPPSSVEEIPNASRHQLWMCLYPLEGSPDGAKFIGGGRANLVEQTGVTTIVYSADRLSRAGRPEHAMTRDDMGLLTVKALLLDALHGVDLLDSGDKLLTQPMECVHAERPSVAGQPFGDLALTWSTPFQWLLS